MGDRIKEEVHEPEADFQDNPFARILKLSNIEDNLEEASDFRARLVSKLEKFARAKNLKNDPSQREDKWIFVTGFDRKRTDIEDLFTYFNRKYGNIVDIQQPKDAKGRRQPYIFIEFEKSEAAEKAVEDSLSANFHGA